MESGLFVVYTQSQREWDTYSGRDTEGDIP